jgi:hypothetical protein
MSSIKHSITRSFIIVPLMATTLSMSAFTTSINSTVAPTISAQGQTSTSAITEPASVKTDNDLLVEREETEAAQIDAYFKKNGMPLAGYGMKMVTEAEKHNLDWRLIPAIAIRESSGGLHQCVAYNPFGFGSCSFGFKSYNDAIEKVSTNLGGDDSRTASAYKGKTTKGILNAYNPPSVVASYANEVLSIMNTISNMPLPVATPATPAKV